MYIDEQGHKFKNIHLEREESAEYFAGWYFIDEFYQLNGPYSTLSEARKMLRQYVYQLSYTKMDYDTFSDSREYKTLPYIMDRVNEMDKYRQAQVSKYFNTLNKVANNLSDIRRTQIKLSLISNMFRHTDQNPYRIDIQYYQDLIIKDFISRIDRQFSKYDPKFVSYLKNFTKAKIRKLV